MVKFSINLNRRVFVITMMPYLVTDTLSGILGGLVEETLSRLFCLPLPSENELFCLYLPSEKGSTLKVKQFLPSGADSSLYE